MWPLPLGPPVTTYEGSVLLWTIESYGANKRKKPGDGEGRATWILLQPSFENPHEMHFDGTSYVPVEQLEHLHTLAAATAVLYVPDGQDVHNAEPVSALYVPVGVRKPSSMREHSKSMIKQLIKSVQSKEARKNKHLAGTRYNWLRVR